MLTRYAVKWSNLALEAFQSQKELFRSLKSEPHSKMANSIAEPSQESTFKSYTPTLAKAFAASRGSYHEDLFKIILDTHKSTGGGTQVLLDVGCGPGNSTRPLARPFDSAYGIDPSQEMVNTARSLSVASSEETASGKSIVFSVGRAEDMDGPFREPGHGVDLLTSAMAVCMLFENKRQRLDMV